MTNTTTNELHRRLREAIKRKGWSMRKASLEAGLSEGTVKAIFRNAGQSPRYETLAALARAFACSVSELTGEAALAHFRDEMAKQEKGLADSAAKLHEVLAEDPHLPQAETLRELLARDQKPPPFNQAPRHRQPEFLRRTPEMGRAGENLLANLYPGRPGARWIMTTTRSLDLAGILPGDFLILDGQLDPRIGDMVAALMPMGRQKVAWPTVRLVSENRRAGAARRKPSGLVLSSHSSEPGFVSFKWGKGVQIAGVVVRSLRDTLQAHA